MRKGVSSKRSGRRRRLLSFTLIELLVVMAVIAALAALTVAAATGAMNQGSRKRAASEIQGISSALESYKADNGTYPTANFLFTNAGTTAYTNNDGSQSAGLYQQSSQVLFMALTGKVNYLDTPVASVPSYLALKINEVGNAKTAAGTASSAATASYVQDPWNYAYGYSTGTGLGVATPYLPYNGSGFFDLWSTGGLLRTTTVPNATNVWPSNWQ